MAAKPVAVSDVREEVVALSDDVYLIALPLDTYRLISDVAAKKNMTFSQAMKQAMDMWISS